MSKFWFFDRKGRPTSNEKRICDKFNSFLDDGSVSKNQVEEYLEEYGKPMNESELEEMFGFLTGNDSNGNKYEYADDSDEDYCELVWYGKGEFKPSATMGLLSMDHAWKWLKKYSNSKRKPLSTMWCQLCCDGCSPGDICLFGVQLLDESMVHCCANTQE